MEWIAEIQKAINYIEDHLLEDINFEEVAKNLFISSFEFHRAFGFLTGITPTTYIRNRRLSLAAKEIIETNHKIIDIALKYCYETSESFTKAFTRFHNVSPKNARNNPSKLVMFNPFSIKVTIEGGSMNYKIIDIKDQKFLVCSKSFDNEIVNDLSNHDIPDFWGECEENKILDTMFSLRKEDKNLLYGLCNSTSKKGEKCFDYGIGILLDEDTTSLSLDEIKKLNLEVWKVPSSKYVVFECVGEDPKIIKETWSKFYKEFLPQMGYTAKNAIDYEVYYGSTRPDLFCELYIPIFKK